MNFFKFITTTKTFLIMTFGLFLTSILLSQHSVAALIKNQQLIPEENVDYYLNDVGRARIGTSDKGCHNQGIKFDGQHFYSSCMDTYGKHTSFLFLHNKAGELIKDFSVSEKFNHPSGILLNNGWAHVGFTHGPIFGDNYSLLFRFNNKGKVKFDGFTDHSVGFVGAKFLKPEKENSKILPRYYSFRQYYERQCENKKCDKFEDITTKTKSLDVQDCDSYYNGSQWYKACILFSSNPNRIRVWEGDETVLTERTSRATFYMDGQPGHSGGFGFYTDPNGTKWIVTAMAADNDDINGRKCGGCFLVGAKNCACTDKDNRQRIRFYKFEHFNWP
jgi:hypothetical protein